MSPWSKLKLRSSLRRKVRFPMTGGSAPTSPVLFNRSATTRMGLRWLHVTPSQLHKPVLQFQEASELPWLTCALKACSVASSLAVAVTIIRMARNEHKLMAMALIAMLLLVWVLPG